MKFTDRLQCDVPTDWYNDPSQCLYEWQGLETAGLAVFAAWMGARWLKRQIKQADDHRDDEIARRHNASRVTLPLALAAIHNLIQTSSDEITGELEQHGPNGFAVAFEVAARDGEPKKKFTPIAVNDHILTAFQSFVESLSRPNDVRHIAELISSIQIFIARFNDFGLQQAGRELGLESLLLDAAKVLLLNDKIYNYVRFVDDAPFGIVGVLSINDSWDAIRGKAQSLVFFRGAPDAFFAGIDARIASYKESQTSPWTEKFGE